MSTWDIPATSSEPFKATMTTDSDPLEVRFAWTAVGADAPAPDAVNTWFSGSEKKAWTATPGEDYGKSVWLTPNVGGTDFPTVKGEDYQMWSYTPYVEQIVAGTKMSDPIRKVARIRAT